MTSMLNKHPRKTPASE